MFDNKEQIRLCIDEDDKELYKILSNEGVLKGKNRNKFLFAMAYGFFYKSKLPLKNKDTGGYWRLYESGLEDRAMVFALTIKENPNISFKTEDELKESLEIAEEYAHGGIKLLYDSYENIQIGTFWKRLERDLFKVYENMILESETGLESEPS